VKREVELVGAGIQPLESREDLSGGKSLRKGEEKIHYSVLASSTLGAVRPEEESSATFPRER